MSDLGRKFYSKATVLGTEQNRTKHLLQRTSQDTYRGIWENLKSVNTKAQMRYKKKKLGPGYIKKHKKANN